MSKPNSVALDTASLRSINVEREDIEYKTNQTSALYENMKTKADTDIKRQDSKSRSRIAIILTLTFVALTAVIIIGGPIYNATIGTESKIDIPQTLGAFGSLFGTVLGFVLGYYFKERNQ